MKILSAFLFIMLVSVKSQAGFLLELNGTYLSDSLKSGTTDSSTRYFYNVGALFNIKPNLWGGWNYLGISTSESSNSVATTFSTADTGPYIKWQFGRSQLYSLSMAYNLLSRATYKTGSSTAEAWQGTSFWISFGIMPELGTNLHLGAALNYYSASYTKKTISGSETSASDSKSWIFPTLSVTKSW
ncbi:MAG: hypothetical protein ACKOX6_13385 [Bdellovibrio sp.]